MKRVVEIISVSYNDISDELIEPSLGRDCIIILTVWLIQTLVAAGWAGLFSGERGQNPNSGRSSVVVMGMQF